MPSTVRNLVGAAGLVYGGVVNWGQPLRVEQPGVYAVSLEADPDSMGGVLPTLPISSARVTELLNARPELTVDGVRPNREIGRAHV